MRQTALTLSTMLAVLACLFCWLSSNAQQTSQSQLVNLDLKEIRLQLQAAPLEFSPAAKAAPLLMTLPLPDGTEGLFKVVESPILSKEFAAQRPDIKTYSVVAADNPAVTGRFTVSDFGLHALLLTPQGMVGIQPVDLLKPALCKVYLGGGDASPSSFTCGVTDDGASQEIKGSQGGAKMLVTSNGATRRTYRIAVVGTGEFHDANGGSVGAAQTVVTNSVNAIQAIYDRELAVRFTLLTPFIYTNFNTDPFTNGDNRTEDAASAVNTNFAQGTYDIGHVFHDQDQAPEALGGGGIAGLGVVCNDNPSGTGFLKAAGWSSSFNNTDNGWINLAAHEIGHQFNAPHTFNGTGESCTAAISSTTAYEIASGTTIMSYQGICEASQNIPGGGPSNHYFHANSLERMVNYMNGAGNCAANVTTGNTPPVVNANPCGGTYTIPKTTPFTLTGSGTDANGDPIAYTWEQYQEDGAGTPTQGLIGAAAGANASAPLFRSYPPSGSPSRTFPPLANIVSGTPSDFEPISTVGRPLVFRLIGRDNNTNGGGIHGSELSITVSGTVGPFAVTVPNGGESWTAGNNVTVNWNHAGSTAFCNNVNIKLSTDGGFTYPITLATNVSNAAGTWTGLLPQGAPNSTSARVKVECADNTCVVFFDISNANFSVTSGCAVESNYICPNAAATFPVGAAGLNLGLNRFFGTAITSHTFNVTTASPMYSVVSANQNNNACHDYQFQNHYGVLQFTVEKTGTYTFTKNIPGAFSVINIFQNTFNPAAPCGTWVASSAQMTAGGGMGGGNTITTTLTECVTYFLVASRAFTVEGFTGTVTMTGVGQVKTSVNGPGGNYNYTYAAVNTATNNIVAVNATSNFTALAAGNYNIFGASYKSGGPVPPANIDPATFVGQSISAIYSAGHCVLFSTNFKPLTVTGGGPCAITSAGLTNVQCNNNGTPNNPADDKLTFQLNPVGTNLGAGYTVTGATLTPTGGTYGAATTFTKAGANGAGNLNLTVTDNTSGACQIAVTVVDPTPAPVLAGTTNPATCGATNGTATIGGLAAGQQFNLSYQFNGVAANAGPLTASGAGQVVLNNLAAGAYTALYVLPVANACPGGPLTFNLVNPAAPTYTVAGTNPTTCGGTNGSLAINGLTANTNYSVSYSLNGTAVGPLALMSNATGTITIANLGAGNYTNIIVSLGGCAGAPATATLAAPNPPTFTATGTDPTMMGGTDGSITLGGAMANAAYQVTYQFNGAAVGPLALTADGGGNILIANLAAGNYTNIVGTTGGCASVPAAAMLTDPPGEFFLDGDGDGFGNGTSVQASFPPPNYYPASELMSTTGDCDDSNVIEFPGQEWYEDQDGDDWGDGDMLVQCEQPPGYEIEENLEETTGDCDNADSDVYPNAAELCDQDDNDCDNIVDEGALATFYRDFDNDGYGNLNNTTQACPNPPAGYVTNHLDCNDSNGNVNPDEEEICNAFDDDCNGQINEGLSYGNYIGNVTLTTQGQVNAFLSCYTKISGNLTIQNSGVNNLSNLSNLDTVTGNVLIKQTSLVTLNGLNGLTRIGGNLTITTNNSGSKLEALTGLGNLVSVGGNLKVYLNLDLGDCCAIYELLNSSGIGGTVSIYQNDTGCDNVAQINADCDSYGGGNGGAFNLIVNEPAAEAAVSLFPNPAEDKLNLEIYKEFAIGTVKFFDLQGRTMLFQPLEENTSYLELRVDELPKGLYLVQVLLDGEAIMQRVMVEGN